MQFEGTKWICIETLLDLVRCHNSSNLQIWRQGCNPKIITDLEAFSAVVSDFEILNTWPLGARWTAGGLQLELPTLSGHAYTLLRSPDLATWQPWTNLTATAAVTRCLDSGAASRVGSFYRALTTP